MLDIKLIRENPEDVKTRLKSTATQQLTASSSWTASAVT